MQTDKSHLPEGSPGEALKLVQMDGGVARLRFPCMGTVPSLLSCAATFNA